MGFRVCHRITSLIEEVRTWQQVSHLPRGGYKILERRHFGSHLFLPAKEFFWLTIPSRLVIIIFVAGLAVYDAEWCNGSTYDSDSYCLGSNPSSAANGLACQKKRGHMQAPMVKRFKTPPSHGGNRGSNPLGSTTWKGSAACSRSFSLSFPFLSLFYVFRNEIRQACFFVRGASE